MKIYEAMKEAIESGKKIRNKNWDDNFSIQYLRRNDGLGNTWGEWRNNMGGLFGYDDFDWEVDGWEIYEEPKQTHERNEVVKKCRDIVETVKEERPELPMKLLNSENVMFGESKIPDNCLLFLDRINQLIQCLKYDRSRVDSLEEEIKKCKEK